MKRFGNLFTTICSMDNLRLADMKARKQKGHQKGVKEFDRDREANLQALHQSLVDGSYRTSAYRVFPIYEPKERMIYMLPYKDRIVHHALMNILEGILVPTFTADTYSCVKGKGVHKANEGLKRALKDRPCTQYCLQLDVRKFYPTVDHEILKQILRRKIKDKQLLALLDSIIDSAEGIPIGNYLSQYFANLYMTYFDHWLKEVKKVRYYFRYADDIVILASNKAELHQLLADIRTYLSINLKLSIKGNYQIYPVPSRGIDFVGYVNDHEHTRVRKRIKQNCARRLKKGCRKETMASYLGWFKHGNCKHLTKKLFINDPFQRNEHPAAKQPLCGEQSKYTRHFKRKYRSTPVQDSGFETGTGQRERPVPPPADTEG